MSRTGVEVKLPWQQVPNRVRQQVEISLGAPVTRAVRIWGGYSPTPTYRLALADGRRAFFKATYQASNEFSTSALHAEARVYQELSGLLAGWMPRFYTNFAHADWHVLLLEDLGPKSVPPWTPSKARAITHALAAFHNSTFGAEFPTWLSQPEERLPQESWTRIGNETESFQQLAALVPSALTAALAWYQAITPRIETLLAHPALRTGPYAILHGDLRSDNLRFAQGKLSLFDWPAITVGRPEWDIVAFAQTVTVEGGIAPEQIMQWYTERFPVDAATLDSALAWWLTFFADKAWQPEIPGLPRVRRFQRQQLGVMASWVARQWSLPEPTWANELLRG